MCSIHRCKFTPRWEDETGRWFCESHRYHHAIGTVVYINQ